MTRSVVLPALTSVRRRGGPGEGPLAHFGKSGVCRDDGIGVARVGGGASALERSFGLKV